MNINKVVILGFALMIFGGIILIINTLNTINVPLYLALLSYLFFIGFILIIIGLIINPKDKDNNH